MNIVNNKRTIDINCIGGNNTNETLFLGYASDINSVQLHFIVEPELSSTNFNYRVVFYKNDTDETLRGDIIYNDGIFYTVPADITHISTANLGHKGYLQLFIMQGTGNNATLVASSNKFPYIIEDSLTLDATPTTDLPNGLWDALQNAVTKINQFQLDTSELHNSDSYIPTSKFLKTLIDNNVTYEFITSGYFNSATNPEKIYIVRHGSGTVDSMVGWLIYIGPKNNVSASDGQTQWYFGLDGALRYRYRADDNSSWGAWYYIENTKNKKNTISRDTEQYPSSLAVYDALQNKESTSNKKNTISSDSTFYPSSLAVYNALQNKENISNKELYDITNDANKYPSSSAVYNRLENKANIFPISVDVDTSSIYHIDNCKKSNTFYYGRASLRIGSTDEIHYGFMLCSVLNSQNITQFFYSATSHEIYYRSCIDNNWETSWKRIQNESNMDKNDYGDPEYYGITENNSHYPSSLAVRNLAKNKINSRSLNSQPIDNCREIGSLFHGSATINVNGSNIYRNGTLFCGGLDSGDAVTQYFFTNIGEIYYRVYANSVWNNWSQIEVNGNKDFYNSSDSHFGITNNNNHYPSSKSVYNALDAKMNFKPMSNNPEDDNYIDNCVESGTMYYGRIHMDGIHASDYTYTSIMICVHGSNLHNQLLFDSYGRYAYRLRDTASGSSTDWTSWVLLNSNSKMELANTNVGYDYTNNVPAQDEVFLRLSIGQLFVCNIDGQKTYWIKSSSTTSVRVSIVDNIPVTTSQLINDGADGEHPFITTSDIVGKMNKIATVTSTTQLRNILPWQFFIYNDSTHDNILCYKTDTAAGYVEIPNMDDVMNVSEKMALPPEVPYNISSGTPDTSDNSFIELPLNQIFYCIINSKKTYWIKVTNNTIIQLSSPSFIPVATSDLVNDSDFINSTSLNDRMKLLYEASAPQDINDVPLGQFFLYNSNLYYKDIDGEYYAIATKNNLNDYIKKIYVVNSTTTVPNGQFFIRNGDLGYRDTEGVIHYIAETGDFMAKIYAVSDSSTVPAGQLFTKNYELCYKMENSSEPVILSTKDYVDNMIGNINSALEALL